MIGLALKLFGAWCLFVGLAAVMACVAWWVIRSIGWGEVIFFGPVFAAVAVAAAWHGWHQDERR